jgi:hypothetical protein
MPKLNPEDKDLCLLVICEGILCTILHNKEWKSSPEQTVNVIEKIFVTDANIAENKVASASLLTSASAYTLGKYGSDMYRMMMEDKHKLLAKDLISCIRENFDILEESIILQEKTIQELKQEKDLKRVLH